MIQRKIIRTQLLWKIENNKVRALKVQEEDNSRLFYSNNTYQTSKPGYRIERIIKTFYIVYIKYIVRSLGELA